MVAAELGFARLYENSLDAVSDRDFVAEFLFAAALLMVHLSRFSEDLILWSSSEFAFITMDDAFTTGSSMMPQKKNPDIPELIRGKTGRVLGGLVSVLTMLKGLPLAYNKDMQEDKEVFFDAVDTIKMCLTLYAAMLRTVNVNAARMYAAAAGDFASATDMADYLVRQGLPFREAHAVVGRLVAGCAATGRSLAELSLEELREASPLLGTEALQLLTPESCVAARRARGGTAREAVDEQLKKARELMEP
jgi:argininosuccinate lyase